MPPRDRREHSGRDVKVQRGMLDIKQRSRGPDGRSGTGAVCVFPAKDGRTRAE